MPIPSVQRQPLDGRIKPRLIQAEDHLLIYDRCIELKPVRAAMVRDSENTSGGPIAGTVLQ
jgi:hypothetical protein